MTEETRLEEMILRASYNAVYALAETQTILQLLVKAEIATPEEVAATRKIVHSQPKYANILNLLEARIVENEDQGKFETLFQKSLTQGRESLTKDEQEYLLSHLDQMTSSVSKPWRDKT